MPATPTSTNKKCSPTRSGRRSRWKRSASSSRGSVSIPHPLGRPPTAIGRGRPTSKREKGIRNTRHAPGLPFFLWRFSFLLEFMRWLEQFGHYSHFALRASLVLPRAFGRPKDLIAQIYNVLLG